MANAWFRLYAEFAHDPKVQMLPEVMQRRYIMLMCLRCSNDLVTLQDEEIAFQLRITAEQLAETKALFIAKGFIDATWNLTNWDKRQFHSDSSSHRVAKHRAAKKNTENDDVTLQKRSSNALDTDTDTEKKKTLVAAATEGCPEDKDGENNSRLKPQPTTEDRDAAGWLLRAQQKVTPKMKAPNLAKWADHIRLMRTVDGRTHREICELFQWAKADAFWSPNCQSPEKLREKWDQLAEKRERAAPAVVRQDFAEVL
jgi:hypothetical protein